MTLGPLYSLPLTVVLLAAAMVGCNHAPENKDAVREGVMEHLSKNSGLDLKSMDIEINDVTFQGSQATAAVAFKPKSSPDAGMSMNYTLERQGSKWIVQQKAGAGTGHSSGMPEPPPAGATGEPLPPGHPPVSPDAGSSKAGDLPAGHPPVAPSATK